MELLEEKLYYIKSMYGFTRYLKDSQGRRIKTTFTEYYEGFSPENKDDWREIFELVPIDFKYEKKEDEKQLKIALEKEQRFDPYQMELF